MTTPSSQLSNNANPSAEDPKTGPDLTAGAPPLREDARQFARRTKSGIDSSSKPSRSVLLAGVASVIALLLFVLISFPGHKPKPAKPAVTRQPAADQSATVGDSGKSLFPITDSGQPTIRNSDNVFVGEQDLQRTATRPPTAPQPADTQPFPGGTLGSIPPFDSEQNNPQAAPNSHPGTGEETIEEAKKERDQPSLVFVHKGMIADPRNPETNLPDLDLTLGLAVGTRLRARLEATASTAVRTPVIAVVEYNYQKNGEIIVPAGSKAFGQIEQADRFGYLSIRFDSLLMPDGSSTSIDAVATDLRLRPLKGKVEGKNTGKNVLIRSLSGIGQVGAVFAGRSGGLDGPLSEGDVVRERLGANIGESADQEIARLNLTERLVVSVDANTKIYVVLDRGTKKTLTRADHGPVSTTQSLDSLRQILQLQRELNQNAETISH
jgi:hypothetical protein